MKETETNDEEFGQNVIELLNKLSEKTGIREWDQWEISDMRRLGKKAEGKARPILVNLTLAWRKREILANNKTFSSGIYATPDYPKEVQIKRKELKKEQEIEVKKGTQHILNMTG